MSLSEVVSPVVKSSEYKHPLASRPILYIKHRYVPASTLRFLVWIAKGLCAAFHFTSHHFSTRVGSKKLANLKVQWNLSITEPTITNISVKQTAQSL